MEKKTLLSILLLVTLFWGPASWAQEAAAARGDIPLRQFVERIMDERHQQTMIRYEATQRALDLATEEMNRRLTLLNELRAEVIKDRAELMTRREFDARIEALAVRITPLERSQDRYMGIMAAVALLSGAAGAVVMKLLFK